MRTHGPAPTHCQAAQQESGPDPDERPESAGNPVLDFVAGELWARSTAVLSIHDPRTATWSHNVFVIVLDGVIATDAHPELDELFDLVDEMGTAAVHELIRSQVRWGLLTTPGADLLKFPLELTAPVPVDLGFLLIAQRESGNLWAAAAGGLIAITTRERFQLFHDPATRSEGLDRCLLLACDPSETVAGLIGDHGWPATG